LDVNNFPSGSGEGKSKNISISLSIPGRNGLPKNGVGKNHLGALIKKE